MKAEQDFSVSEGEAKKIYKKTKKQKKKSGSREKKRESGCSMRKA